MAGFLFIGSQHLHLLRGAPHLVPEATPAQASPQLLLLLGLVGGQLLCLSPEYIFQVSGEPFTQPLLGPVSGPDSQAKPGVSDFMAEAGPTEMAHSGQDALGEEDDVWAGHPQAWEAGRDDEYIQSGERVCSQDRVCC